MCWGVFVCLFFVCLLACRYDNSTLDSFFCVGLQGIREEDTAKVEEIVLNTLETVSRLFCYVLLFFEVLKCSTGNYSTGLNLHLCFEPMMF